MNKRCYVGDNKWIENKDMKKLNMIEKDDWRLRGQEEYLQNIKF